MRPGWEAQSERIENTVVDDTDLAPYHTLAELHILFGNVPGEARETKRAGIASGYVCARTVRQQSEIRVEAGD